MPSHLRPGPTCHAAALGLVSLLLATAGSAHAQVRFGVRAGVRGTSNLVRDSIVEPITVRPNPAAFLGAVVDTRLDPRYRLGVSLEVSRSDVVSRTPQAETEVTTLTMWSPAVTLAQQLGSWIAVEAKIGALIYDPGRRTGTIFRDGAPVDPVIGLSVAATRPLGARFAASLDVAYDVHRFSTITLQNFGFTGDTTVHRIAVSVTIRTNGATPTP